MTNELGKVPTEDAEEAAVEQPVTPTPQGVTIEDVKTILGEFSKSIDAKLSALKPVEQESEDPAEALEAARARIAELESAQATYLLESAIRSNAEAAGVKVGAALDSGMVRAALKDVNLSDSDAIQKNLKDLASKHDYLVATTHARVPKKTGDIQSRPAGSGMTKESFKNLNSVERIKFMTEHPDEWQELMKS